MVLRLNGLILFLGDLLSGEVGPADGTVERFEAPGIDAAGMEGVCTGRFAHQVVSFDLHQADGADVAVVAQGKRFENGHLCLEVGDIVDFGHLRQSPAHCCRCHRPQSSPPGDEDGASDDEEEGDEGSECDEHIVVDEKPLHYSLRYADGDAGGEGGVVSDAQNQHLRLSVRLVPKLDVGRCDN